MAKFKYLIICTSSVIEDCNAGNTVIQSITINNIPHVTAEVEPFRVSDNLCAFMDNKVGLEAGNPGGPVKVEVIAVLTSGAAGNRQFQFFMCANNRKFDGPLSSGPNDPVSGRTVLTGNFTVGDPVDSCETYLSGKLENAGGVSESVAMMSASASEQFFVNKPVKKKKTPKSKEVQKTSVKEHTKRIIKRIIGE